LQLGLLASIADFERSLIRERVVAGLKAAKAKGKMLGRPSLAQATKDRMRHMLAEGFKERVIATECGVSVASVYKMKKLALVA
jgi:DNA invertase Pin-like site-specific DNA recombinase